MEKPEILKALMSVRFEVGDDGLNFQDNDQDRNHVAASWKEIAELHKYGVSIGKIKPEFVPLNRPALNMVRFIRLLREEALDNHSVLYNKMDEVIIDALARYTDGEGVSTRDDTSAEPPDELLRERIHNVDFTEESGMYSLKIQHGDNGYPLYFNIKDIFRISVLCGRLLDKHE